MFALVASPGLDSADLQDSVLQALDANGVISRGSLTLVHSQPRTKEDAIRTLIEEK